DLIGFLGVGEDGNAGYFHIVGQGGGNYRKNSLFQTICTTFVVRCRAYRFYARLVLRIIVYILYIYINSLA
ncbi:hypothetical protein, partial [Barnesiella intestinihominis]|uniref:hypothetical protein n=1 Tax=Barnesiella intestinihominis TaxID=487174 RepID=UPI001E639DD3